MSCETASVQPFATATLLPVSEAPSFGSERKIDGRVTLLLGVASAFLIPNLSATRPSGSGTSAARAAC